MKLACFAISLLVFALPSFAIPPGQWQCSAFDNTERDFSAVGHSLKEAKQAAIERCKAESPQAKTCKSAQSFCEQGPLSLNSDECIVTDNTGRSWSATGEDACRTAMSMCYQFQYLHGGPRGQCSVKHDGG